MITETHDHIHAGVIHRFESVTEWYRYAEGVPYQMQNNPRHNAKFYGVQSVRDAVRYCERNIGEEHMRAAKDLVNRIDASFRDREQSHWHASPFGAYPVVPDYLAGDPFSMRHRMREEDSRAPVRYYIECVVSSGVGLHSLERRAAGLAALIMRTAEERPVELHCVVALKSGGRQYLATVPINSHPVDLHSTIAAFATREFCRAMAFGNAGRATGHDFFSCMVDWLFGHPTPDNTKRELMFREALGLEPQDVFMQGGYLSDARLFDNDPVQWVHQQIEKQRGVE